MCLGICVATSLIVSCGGGGGSSSAPSSGGGQSSSAQATAPAKPGNIDVTVNSTQAALDWTAVANADSYALYQADSAIDGLANAQLVEESITGTSYTVTDLENDNTYFFALVAQNEAGTSPASDNVVALVTSVNADNQFKASIDPKAFVVTPDSVADFHSRVISATPTRIEFDGIVGGFSVGDIIVSPSGDLQYPSIFAEIISIDESSGNSVFEIETAGLADAFSSLEAEASYTLDLTALPVANNQKGQVKLGKVYKTEKAPQKLTAACGTHRAFVADITLANRISGCMALDARLDFEVSVQPGQDLRWKTEFVFDTNTNLETLGETRASYSTTQNLYSENIQLPPLVVGLLAFENTFNISMGGRFVGDSALLTGLDSSGRARAGLMFEQGEWSPIAEASPSYDFYPPEDYDDVSASVFAGPGVQSKLYGLVGPAVLLRSGIDVEGNSYTGRSSFNSDYFMQTDIGLSFAEGVDAGDILAQLLGITASNDTPYDFSEEELMRARIFEDSKVASGGGSGGGNSSQAASSSSVASSSTASSVTADQPTLEYDFDGDSQDGGSSGNDAWAYGAVKFPEENGNRYLHINNSATNSESYVNQYVEMPPLNASGGFTTAFWFQPLKLSNSKPGAIYSLGTAGSGNAGLQLLIDAAGQLQILVSSGEGQKNLMGPWLGWARGWAHLAIAVNEADGSIDLVVNGEHWGRYSDFGFDLPSFTGLSQYLGLREWNGGSSRASWLSAYFDDLYIFPWVVSGSDIEENYQGSDGYGDFVLSPVFDDAPESSSSSSVASSLAASSESSVSSVATSSVASSSTSSVVVSSSSSSVSSSLAYSSVVSSLSSSAVTSSSSSTSGGGAGEACESPAGVITSGVPSILGDVGENVSGELWLPSDQSILSRAFTVGSQVTWDSARVALVPALGSVGVTTKLWISACPGGEPVMQDANCSSQSDNNQLRLVRDNESRFFCTLHSDNQYYINAQLTSGSDICQSEGQCRMLIQQQGM